MGLDLDHGGVIYCCYRLIARARSQRSLSLPSQPLLHLLSQISLMSATCRRFENFPQRHRTIYRERAVKEMCQFKDIPQSMFNLQVLLPSVISTCKASDDPSLTGQPMVAASYSSTFGAGRPNRTSSSDCWMSSLGDE